MKQQSRPQALHLNERGHLQKARLLVNVIAHSENAHWKNHQKGELIKSSHKSGKRRVQLARTQLKNASMKVGKTNADEERHKNKPGFAVRGQTKCGQRPAKRISRPKAWIGSIVDCWNSQLCFAVASPFFQRIWIGKNINSHSCICRNTFVLQNSTKRTFEIFLSNTAFLKGDKCINNNPF